jgi:hypothetical protein
MPLSESWDMNTAGWHRELSERGVTVVPCDIDAALTIGSFHKSEGAFSSDEIEQMARAYAPHAVECIPVTRGDFAGFTAEYDEDDEGETLHWRMWWLYADRLHLFICYNSSPKHSDLHRNIVDWMLGTLRYTAKTDPGSVN